MLAVALVGLVLLATAGRGPVAPARQAAPPPVPTACVAHDGLPDSRCTPGALNVDADGQPVVTQDNIAATICRPGGYTRSVRPPVSYTTPLKRELARAYGYGPEALAPAAAELDHLVPLSSGGNPRDPANLWVELTAYPDGSPGFHDKDQVELAALRAICAGTIPLAEAQAAFMQDWTQLRPLVEQHGVGMGDVAPEGEP